MTLGPKGGELKSVQVFVANPNKSPEVIQILAGNKERLLTYLGDFHTDKGRSVSGALLLLHEI